MADLSDVTAYLAQAAAAAVYPNGEDNPSVFPGMDIRIYEGWPNPSQLDLDISGQRLSSGDPPVPVRRPNGPVTNVSIYPMPGATMTPYQILDNNHVIVAASMGMTPTQAGNVVTVAGQPNAGEYLTLIADRQHTYSRSGVSTAAIIAALAADALVDYPATTFTATTLTVPARFQLEVRVGSIGTLGRVTHRQKQSVMITTWAPNEENRAAIAAAIDNVLKRTNVFTLPDTTQAVLCYNRTNVSDAEELATVYRRDLIYDVEYATLWQFPGYVITSVNNEIAAGNWAEQTPSSVHAIS